MGGLQPIHPRRIPAIHEAESTEELEAEQWALIDWENVVSVGPNGVLIRWATEGERIIYPALAQFEVDRVIANAAERISRPR